MSNPTEPRPTSPPIVDNGHNRSDMVEVVPGSAGITWNPLTDTPAIQGWCSWNAKTDDGLAALMKCLGGADLKSDDVIGQELDLWGVYAAPVEIHNTETGEVSPAVRVVLVTADRKTIGFVSTGMLKSVKALLLARPDWPWNPPLRVRVRQLPVGSSRRTFGLEYIPPALPARKGGK